ncbi:hypothetical protein JTB14_032249 [Gonioctena quinquepunctata]|nr:hypothetical protein JTB14_032249 [Gonioctena quinquepunctata]
MSYRDANSLTNHPRELTKKVDVPAGESIAGADFCIEKDEPEDKCSDIESFRTNDRLEGENGQEESEKSDEDIYLTLVEMKKREKQIPEKNECFASYNQKTFDNVSPISPEAIKESIRLVVAFLTKHGKMKKFKNYIEKVLSFNKNYE